MKAVIIRFGLNNIKLSPNFDQKYVLSLDNNENLVCELKLYIDKTDQKDSNKTDQTD